MMRVCQFCGLLCASSCDGCGRAFCVECMNELSVLVIGPGGLRLPLVSERICDRCMVRRRRARRPVARSATAGLWM